MRRRRNPETTLSYRSRPFFHKVDEAEIRLNLNEGLIYSGEAEYARGKVLVPLIDDLSLVMEELEARRDLQDTGDPMTQWTDERLQAEYYLMRIILIMLNVLNVRIRDDPEVIWDSARGSDEGARRLAELLAKDNPRRRRRVKRY